MLATQRGDGLVKPADAIGLNGAWEMQPEEAGLDRPTGDRWCRVTVPMPWSAFLRPSSGVPSAMVPHRMAWFRRRVRVPEVSPLCELLLHFEAVNFFATVFVNGKRCGEHAGDAIPFDLDITPFVTPGRIAEILVGVQDISYAETRDRSGRPSSTRRLLYPGLPHHPGIWGDVWLRVAPKLRIVGVTLSTTLSGQRRTGPQEGRIRVRVRVQNATGRGVGFSLTNEVYDGARQALAFAPVRGIVAAGETTEIEMGTAWDTAALWWPDQPNLYTLRTALWSSLGDDEAAESPDTVSEVVDRLNTPMGFRQFRIEGRSFLLNNVPVQLLSDALCPVSGRLFGEMPAGAPAHPIGLEQAKERLAALKKERGLNAVRFHRIPPSPTLLEAADAVGLLAVVELPLPDDEGRYAIDRSEFWVNAQELTHRWIAARAHHPSVVMWSIDQGMVRRYGRAVIPGLRSLARFVADLDPTRPVEHGGDAGLADSEDLAEGAPVSVFFPRAGVALRTAGPYEPELVRGRLFPREDLPSPWLPDRPTDRPLCVLEHIRHGLTPNGLAFFLGDAAYAAGADLGSAAASLALLEMGACRMAGLAAVHTVGRPQAPMRVDDTAGDLVALQKELFANFYAGTRFAENLVLRNDTRYDQDCQLVSRFTPAGGEATEHAEELLLAAGSQEEKGFAFELPDVRQVRPASEATSRLAEFCIELTGSRAGMFRFRRKIAVWPHVRATGGRRIGLCDPDGGTAAALSAVGARYAAAHGAPHEEFDTLIIGENALERGSAPDREAIHAFVERGGLAIVLAQHRVPYDLSPVSLVLDDARAASVTFVRDAEHPILAGLSSFEMRWWQDDHRVAGRCFRKPSSGNFRCLVDVGGPGGLRWAAAVEVFSGRGSYLFSQMELVAKAPRAPVAGLLLARMADATPSWRPAGTRVLAGDAFRSAAGIAAPELRQDFAADDLEGVQAVVMAAEAFRRLASSQLRVLRDWLREGRCLSLHHLEPEDAVPLQALSGLAVELHASPQERLVFDRPGLGLARGLSSADLYYVDHGARFLGRARRRAPAATVVARAQGDAVVGVASTVRSPSEHGLLWLRVGRGRVVVDEVRWDVDTRADGRAGRYISTLLTNLGVPLRPREVVPSDRARPVDISAACNSTLADPLPGDGEGWTDRGPDDDLSAFSPGLLLAADGVPFRVASRRESGGRNCCVLRSDTRPTAPAIQIGAPAARLAFLVACEGHVRRGVPIAHFTVRYEDGLETRVPMRWGVNVMDWNERPRDLEGARAAWKGRTALGEPAAVYATVWQNARPDVAVHSVVFSSTHSGATPALLALTALT